MIISLLVLGCAVYFVHTTLTVRGQVPYRTYLRYAGGLAPGVHVLFGGIKVGQVTAVRPWSEDPTQIETLFEVKSGTPLNQNSTARVGTVSLMSSPVLSITTGSKDARHLGPGEVVPSEEAVSMEEIMQRVSTVANSVTALTTQIRQALPGLTGEALTVLRNVNEITGVNNRKHIEQILAELNQLLRRESPKIARLTDQFSALTEHADSLVISVQPVVANVDRTVTNLNKTVTNVNGTVEAVREPLAKDLAELERAIHDARALLVSLEGVVDTNEADIADTVRNLRDTSENVRALTETLKQRPWSLIRIKQPPDRKVPR